MKKIVSTLIAGLMAFSLVVMGCSNDSSSDNTALMLLVSASSASSGSSGSGSSGGTKPAGGAVNALSGAQAGATVDLSEYELSDKIALTVDKAITVKNAKLNGGYITVSEEATLDNVDGGTIVLVGNGKNATLKDCDAKNVIVKEAELKEADLSRVVQYFTLKINGGVVENIVNNDLNLIIETTKTTIKNLITNQSLVINSTDDSKIELISSSAQITLAGKLVIEKAVTESIVKVSSKTVSIHKGMVEIEADDSEYADKDLDIEAIKAAVGELTDSECEALYKTVTALEKEAEELKSKIQAAEEEAKKALEEYEKEQEKTVVTVYFVDEGKVSPEQKVPLAEVEKYLEGMTADMPDYVEIGFFSDKACTKPVEVKNIKAGDTIYIQVLISGGVVTVCFVDEGKVSPEQKVPLAELEKVLEGMTADDVEIELFSDEACTKPVDVKTIKAGDKIYVKVSGDIHDEPVIPGEYFIVCFVDEGQVSPEQKVPLAELENFLKGMTAGMPAGVEIGLFSDEACTKLVDVKTIKAGDKIYVKVSGDIHDEPVTPGEYVIVYFVDEGKVSPGQKVPLTAVEKYLEDMTASIPEGGKIEFFSDEACTTPVDVKDIKDGDKIYIKVSGDIHDEPVISGEYVTFYEVYEGQVSPERKVPLAALENFLEGMTAGMPAGVEIGLFSDEACTTPVDVETIKAGDRIYIKYPEYSDLPDVPGEPDVDLPDVPGEPDEDLPVVIVNGENVPLYTMIADLEDGQSFYINGEVNKGNENGWLLMMENVFIFTYDEKMNAWGSKTGSVKVNMTRDEAAENPYADGVKVVVWDIGENISWEGGAIGLNGLVQGKMYALVMTNSEQANNTDGKGKHVELYEVAMNGIMGE